MTLDALTKEQTQPTSTASDRDRASRGILSKRLLRLQNRTFRGTGGVSKNNRSFGFVPAYFDRLSGQAIVSSFADGSPAPIHVLDGLPADWIEKRDCAGHVTKARPGVVAGFLRGGEFFTREAAAQVVKSRAEDR